MQFDLTGAVIILVIKYQNANWRQQKRISNIEQGISNIEQGISNDEVRREKG